MEISPVSSKQLKSIPASIPAMSTPLRVAFKGLDEDRFEPQNKEQEVQETSAEGQTAQKPTIEDFKKKVQDFNDGTKVVADNTKEISDNITKTGKDIAGTFAVITAFISKLIPTPVKDFFAPPQLDEAGEQIIKKGSDGIERVARTLNKTRLGIAAGIVIGGALLFGIYKHVSNKSKQAQKAQNA